MTIVRNIPRSNGGRPNQTVNGVLKNIPDGWLVVPEELEAAARAYLPWLNIEVQDGVIVGVSENVEARAAFEAALAEENDEEDEADGN